MVTYDDFLFKAVQKQRAVVDVYPCSRASMAFKNLSSKVAGWSTPASAGGRRERFVERQIQITRPMAEGAL